VPGDRPGLPRNGKSSSRRTAPNIRRPTREAAARFVCSDPCDNAEEIVVRRHWSSESLRMRFDYPFKCREHRRMIDNLAGLQGLLAFLDGRQESLLIGDIGL
jgi:hypothetical protein